MVVVTHVAYVTGFVVYGGALGALAARMDFGVAIFFLLSGYLLYRPWARAALGGAQAPALRLYARRRAARLLPAYVVAMVVIFTFLPQADTPPVRTWVANATFTQIYLPGTLVEGFTQTWSLATEVSFYIALPIVVGLAARMSTRNPVRGQVALLSALALGGLAFVTWRAFGNVETAPLSGFWLPSFLLWFAVGMTAALLSEAAAVGRLTRATALARTIAAESTACLIAGLLILVLMATPLAGPYTLDPSGSWSILVKHVGYAAAALFLLLPSFLGSPGHRRSWHERLLATGSATWLGQVSYGIFLWHLAVMWVLLNLVGRSAFTGGFAPLLAATIAATIAVAAVSWHALEAPVLRRAHRR